MRIAPIITAIFVSAFIYTYVLEREALLAFAGGADATATKDEPLIVADSARKPVAVLALKSERREFENSVLLRGRTEAFRNITVKAEVSGQVISDPLRRGSFVEEGNILCRLDKGTREVDLAEAKARLAEAENNAEISNSLVTRGFASETSVVARQAALEGAVAAVERAQDALKNLVIRAPFSGLLETDTAEFGDLMQVGSPCATIISLDPIKLVGFATEEQVQQLEIGAMGGGQLVSGKQILGELTFVARSSDPETRTYRVEVTVPNPGLRINDGATAEIAIALSDNKGHLLPQSALTLNDDGVLGVRTVEYRDGGEFAAFQPVKILRDSTEGIWVSGLGESADVIIIGQEFVKAGRAISVSFKETS